MAPKPKSKKKQDAQSAKPTKGADAVAPTASRPNWPPLSPLVPTADLCLNTLLGNQVLTIPRLWSSSLCRNYVSFLSSLPLSTTPGKPKRGEAVRVNDRYQVDDADFAARLWGGTGLKSMVEKPTIDGKELSEPEKMELWGGHVLGLNSHIRVYRYSKGQFFDQHCELTTINIFIGCVDI